MQLSQSLRKLVVAGITGTVIVAGGAAFAEELAPEDPMAVEESGDDARIDEGEVADDPTDVDEADVDEDADADDSTDDSAGDVDEGEVAVADDPADVDEADEPADVDEVDEDADDATAGAGDAVEETAAGAQDADAEGSAHPDNHGAAVSEAAHAPTPDGARNHGEAVSAVARDNHGHRDRGADDEDETEAVETEDENDDAEEAEETAATTEGADHHGNGRGHGKDK